MLYERRYYEMIGLEIWTPHGKSPPPQIPHTEGKYHWTPRYYEAFPVGDAERENINGNIKDRGDEKHL